MPISGLIEIKILTHGEENRQRMPIRHYAEMPNKDLKIKKTDVEEEKIKFSRAVPGPRSPVAADEAVSGGQEVKKTSDS